MQTGVDGFVAEMASLGLEPALEAELVVYRVTPVDGAYAGRSVESGVSPAELSAWPQAPPHWVHLPESIGFTRTNSQPSPKPGWLMHSRQIAGWGSAPSGVEWAGHVRAVLGQAVA